MKGIVFNLLEESVRRQHGEETWDLLLERSGLDGAYTSMGSYPDEQMNKLVSVAAEALGLSADEVIRWFGRSALPILAEKFPHFFAPHRSTRSFLLTLNDVIHPEVRKLYPGADVPVFDYDTSSEEFLLMGYSSPRGLCAFGEGLIEGAAAYFGERIDLDQPKCAKRGDEKCLFRVSFAGRQA